MDAIEKVLHECGQKPQALMILGPTAGGKSALSLEIARRHDVEIISMDSALVYRGMDIGTAKPTKEERAVCPHHLIDIRDIGEAYSAADFLEDAVRLVGEIRSRGRLPLIVGGTMLYAKALRDGINDMPSSTHEVREAVATEAAERGWPAMHAELGRIEDVVDAHGNEVLADRVVTAELEGEHELGAHAVRAGDENRVLVFLADFEERAEAADGAEDARDHRALGKGLDAFNEFVAGIDGNAGSRVGKLAHGKYLE